MTVRPRSWDHKNSEEDSDSLAKSSVMLSSVSRASSCEVCLAIVTCKQASFTGRRSILPLHYYKAADPAKRVNCVSRSSRRYRDVTKVVAHGTSQVRNQI